VEKTLHDDIVMVFIHLPESYNQLIPACRLLVGITCCNVSQSKGFFIASASYG
jgi:hypothetical protein